MAFKDKETEKAYYVERRRKKREFLDKLRDRPCLDCGGKFPTYVMEFDHVPERGKKSFPVANGGNWSLISGPLLEELKKCDVICANCHRIRTYKRASYSGNT